jgi:mevalonate kinase
MKKVVVSVPGKIHLMGEHAVVYGKPALLAAINLRLTVTIEESDDFGIVTPESDAYVRYAIEFLTQAHTLFRVPNVKISIDSMFPAGFHLGSSAAVAVGVAGAFTYYVKNIWNPMAINQLAYEIEKKMHGNPSGGDNTTVTVGGFVWFRKELEFLKSIWQLPMKLPADLNHFSLIDTGRPKETTRDMITFVKNQKNLPEFLEKNEIETKKITTAIKEGDEKMVIEAMRNGERTLEAIGVVSGKVIHIIRDIEKNGGAAKILGGGGRSDGVGYLLCYTKKPLEKNIPIVLGGEGIQLEQKQ